MKSSFVISSWSPYCGQTCTTTNLVAISTYVAITKGLSQLLMSSRLQRTNLENAYYEDFDSVEALLFEDIGINALERLASTKQLNTGNFKDYAKTIIAQRLDIIFGSAIINKKMSEELIKTILYIILCARQCYDIVFCDIGYGLDNEITLKMLENTDRIIVNLNQNVSLLTSFFGNTEIRKVLQNKEYLIVLGNYESDSKYTVRYIKKIFGFESEIFAVPRNVEFMDAVNDHRVVEYFFSNYGAGRDDSNYLLMNELEKIAQKIIGFLKIDKLLIPGPIKNESIFNQIYRMIWK